MIQTALMVVQAATGLASLFGPKSEAAAMQRAQVEMLRTMQLELKAIGEALGNLSGQVNELRELILNLPDATVAALNENRIVSARKYFETWLETYEERQAAIGLEATNRQENTDFTALKDNVLEPAGVAGLGLTDTIDYARIPIVSLAAFLDLTARVHIASIDPAHLPERMRDRKNMAEKYAEWFQAVVDARGEGSLHGTLDKVERERKLLNDFDEPWVAKAVVIVERTDFPVDRPNPCGMVKRGIGDKPSKGSMLTWQEFSMSRRWLKLAESGENAALLSAAASLIAEEYLAENDLPRSVESEITPIGLATQTLVCWEGPNKGMPYGGGPRGLLDSGTFETYSQAAKDLDTEDNELSSRTGIQMIALKSLWRTCYETLDWLSQVQKLSAEAAAR